MGGHPRPRLSCALLCLLAFIVSAKCQPIVTSLRGQDAVDYLNAQPGVAAATGSSTAIDVKAALLSDWDAALVVRDGREPALRYTCNMWDPAAIYNSSSVHSADITPPNLPDEPIANAFVLHSRPGAPRIIHLDFDGATFNDLLWNPLPEPSFTVPAYNSDGIAGFSDTELREIISIWRAVAEDYAPFDVDVTTETPAAGALDNGVGVQLIIGGKPEDIGISGAAGVAYLNVFGKKDMNRAFTFQGSEIRQMAKTTSHEVGHTLGLTHDGCKTSGNNGCFGPLENPLEYYRGHNNWMPIMGGGAKHELTQWSIGEYADANKPDEDDLKIISGKIPWVTDAVGNSIASSRALVGVTTAAGASVTDLIERSGDIDVYDVGEVAGELFLTFSIVPRDFQKSLIRSNLDAMLQVLDAAGDVVDTWTNAAGLLEGSRTTKLPAAGKYYVSIQGVGQDTPQTGWSPYGSLGSYSLAVRAESSIKCSVTDQDKELPSVAAVNTCLYPKGKGKKYDKTRHCFAAPELATITDNCPNARLDIQSCQLISPALSKRLQDKVVPCSVKPEAQSLCVSLEHLNDKAPRKIRAVVRGTDSSGNFVDVNTTVTINSKRPKRGADKTCKLV